ncbi:hypothetical protein [Photobacterium leiognathi]|uniref:hypothetical protein n=1 Tax=Photobacterium leiognathi TaxID=553611 RepID=UPI002982B589|nr:hypothetical protein [Photobacterium leiognathi]
MNKLAKIRTLWIGSDLSRLEYICLNSFIKQGHEVYLYTYEDVKNIPPLVKVVDANKIISKEKIFTYGGITGKGKGSYAGFANYFRYKMLSMYENTYWVDADVICLKPFVINSSVDICSESGSFINNAVVGVRDANHPLFNELIKYCENPFEIKIWDDYKQIIKKVYGRFIGGSSFEYLPWGTTGPKALTGFAKQFGIFPCKTNTYYPIYSNSWEDIFFATNISLDSLSESKGLHLWNEKLRREGIDKNTVFDRDSIYEKLISRFDLEN